MAHRGQLVDRCDQCGAYLRPMTHEQHAVVEFVYAALSQQVDWPRGSGVKLEPFEWHQLMVGAFAKEKGWKPKFLPALDGDGFTMVTRQKQSRLTKRQGSELIEFARAWAIDAGAVLPEREVPGNHDEAPPVEAYAAEPMAA